MLPAVQRHPHAQGVAQREQEDGGPLVRPCVVKRPRRRRLRHH